MIPDYSTDLDIMKLRHTIFASLRSDADAAKAIAHRLNKSEDGIRGVLSRASHNPALMSKLMQFLATDEPDVAPSVQRQIDIIHRSKDIWARWHENDNDMTAVFLSDLHLPFVRFDAYELALTIINDIDADIVSGANDFRDNTGYGRWEDDRPVRGQIQSSDVANINAMELAHYRGLSSKLRLVVQIAGNHDLWFYKNLRENTPKTAEQQIADYMDSMMNAGLIQFSRGYEENYLELGKGLIWWHGQFTAKNPAALAKQNIEQFLHEKNDGILRSVVCGHTHRPMAVDGTGIGYPSVKFVNSGALTDYTPYMKRHPQGHGLGIVVCRFNFQEWEHEVDLVQFTPKGNSLRASYKGVNYTVELNTTRKEEYL